MELSGNDRNKRVVVVSARRRRTAMYGLMIVVLILGMAVSLTAQPTVSGRVTAVVFFGLFIALCVWLWLRVNRGRNRIEVAADAIRYLHWNGGVEFTLSRDAEQELRLIPRLRDHGFVAGDRLTIVGSGDVMSLSGFSPRAVRRACQGAGWRFADRGAGVDPELAARDLRRFREAGRLVEAAQLVDLFGPYDVDANRSGTTSLGAAVLEEYADQMAQLDRRAARAAYERAAAEQRSFAAYATSGGEGAARMAEAERLRLASMDTA
jgi:hypothetical protein